MLRVSAEVTRQTLVAAVGLFAMGCSVGLRPPTIEEGRAFQVSKCSSVHRGLAEKDVEALLGEPLRIDRKDSVEHGSTS